ncbi:unannotated protein [freshwater metagenome]|uniref:Unannotated protein n=1 Tax=freshwater metagenome TaxID=449393 RepID=A0A6J7FIM3_9ZZZZ
MLFERVHLAAEGLQFTEAADGDLDGRDEVALLIRLDQVGQRTGVAGLLDDLALAERREDEHAAQPLGVDQRRSREPVHARHLDVEDGQIGAQFAYQLDRLVATAGFSDDVVALFLEGLFQVEPDDGFIFGDHHSDGHGQSFR